MSDLGPRSAFRVIGIISGVVGVIYSTMHYFWLRKVSVRPPSRRASVKSFSCHKIGKLFSLTFFYQWFLISVA